MTKTKRAIAIAVAATLAFSFAGVDESVVYAKKASVQKTGAQSGKHGNKKVKTGKTKGFKIKKNMVITDKTIDKLPKVLESKKSRSITLKLTATQELIIEGGDFSTKNLSVDASNTSVINHATFDGIKVDAVGVFNEKGNANNIEINTDKDTHVVIDTERRVSSITYGKEASGTNSVEVKDGALANVIVGNTSPVGLSASGDASVGTVNVEGAGANVNVNASDKSRVNRLSINKEAASAYTYVSVVAAGKAVIKNIFTAAKDAVLSVTANDNAQVNNVKAVGKTNIVVNGTSVKSIKVDVTGMDAGSSVVVNNSRVKVEKDKDQNISDLIKNSTGSPITVEDRRNPGDAPVGNDASTSIGSGWSGGGSGSSGSSGSSGAKKGIRKWESGRTTYVDSAKAHIIEANLEELVDLPSGTSNLKGKDLVVTMKVKNAACSKTGVNAQTNLAVMSDGWLNWYGEDWQGITLQEDEKEYTLKLSFDKYHGEGTKANPKYYRLRFEGEGLSLSYMITGVSIVNHVDAVLPVVGNREQGENSSDTGDDQQADGGLFRDADFSGNGWGTYVATEQGAAGTISFAGGKAIANITNVGHDDWQVQMKQENLTLLHGKTYRFTASINTTAARKIKAVVMQPGDTWCGDAVIDLQTGDNDVSVDIRLDGGSDENKDSCTFQFSMGQMFEGPHESRTEIDTAASTITISNPKLVEVEGNDSSQSEDTGDGNEGQGDDQSEDTGDGNEGQEQNTPINLLGNNWYANSYCGDGNTSEYVEGEYVFSLVSELNDQWGAALKKDGVSLEQGKRYKVSFDVESNVARSLSTSLERAKEFDSDPDYPNYGGTSFEVTAGEKKTVTYYVDVNGTDGKISSDNVFFRVCVGKHSGESTNICVLKFSNASIVEVTE